MLWTVKSPHPLLRIPALSCVRSLLNQSGATLFSCALHIKPHRNRRRCWVIVNSPVGKVELYVPSLSLSLSLSLSRFKLKLKPKPKGRKVLFWSDHSELCFLAALYLPSTSTDVTVSRVPSPESRPRSAPTAPRSRFLGFPEPARSPTDPASSLHGSRNPRGSPGYPHGLRRLLVPEDPSVTPPTAHAPAPRSPSCQLNRLWAVLATPVSAWLFGSFLRCTPGPRFPGYFPRCFAANYNRITQPNLS